MQTSQNSSRHIIDTTIKFKKLKMQNLTMHLIHYYSKKNRLTY